MKRFIRKSVSASLVLVLVIQVISGLSGCSRTKTDATGYDGTTDQRILILVNGDMKYSVVIFDPGDGAAYADIETPARSVKHMFQRYPFLGIVRMERSCTSNGSMDNVFQVGTSGGAAKDLNISNPTESWALEPLRGYQRSMTSWGALNISAKPSDVAVLERYGDGTPAITVANYY